MPSEMDSGIKEMAFERAIVSEWHYGDSGIMYSTPISSFIAKEIIDFISFDIYDSFDYIIDHHCSYINESLSTHVSKNRKLQWIEKRLDDLRIDIEQNDYYTEGYVHRYPDWLLDPFIIDHIYKLLTKPRDIALIKEINSQSKPCSAHYMQPIDNIFGAFYLLNYDIIEVKVLKSYYDYIDKSENSSNHRNTVNPYPLVFKSAEDYNFFVYCLTSYSKRNQSLFSKFFIFFSGQGLLISDVRDEHYIAFVLERFNFKISRIRKDRSIESIESQFYNLRKSYKQTTD